MQSRDPPAKEESASLGGWAMKDQALSQKSTGKEQKDEEERRTDIYLCLSYKARFLFFLPPLSVLTFLKWTFFFFETGSCYIAQASL
jgi:hypothetical protein